MTDRESELVERWHRERPAFDAWGKFVLRTISELVAKEIMKEDFEAFFKMPLKHRLKDDASLLAKAFSRGKPYQNPYEEIEDKVGGRVVVLFSEDIRIVERVINSHSSWKATLARDFEQERILKPYEFDYQSLHYILRSSEALVGDDGVLVSPDTPCEVQIRTLLQHAYSELTHDTIYKPSVQADPKVKRAAAKSMALIEATDEYFTQVRDRLAKALAPGKKVSAILDNAYNHFVGVPIDKSPLNTLLVDRYSRWAREDFDAQINAFLKEKAYIADFVRGRAPKELLYRQPAVLMVYFAVRQSPNQAASESPLTRDEIAPIYSDLGERLPAVLG